MNQRKAKFIREKAWNFIKTRHLDDMHHRTVYQSLKKLWNETPRNLKSKLFS